MFSLNSILNERFSTIIKLSITFKEQLDFMHSVIILPAYRPSSQEKNSVSIPSYALGNVSEKIKERKLCIHQ